MIKGWPCSMCKGGRTGKEKKQLSHGAVRLDKASLNEEKEKSRFKDVKFLQLYLCPTVSPKYATMFIF